jgi:hypothetical protein
MTVDSKPYPVFEPLLKKFGEWLEHWQESNEIRQLDSTEFDRIASDLQVSSNDLIELVRRGPHAADELPKLLKLLGIDEAALARAQPLILHDMERVCAMCHEKGQCDRHLAAGTSAEHYEGYCLNAATIKTLENGTKP